jgi:hypothetical protein
VQQPDHQVSAVFVGPEEELPPPGRTDRDAIERDDVRSFAVDCDLVGEVILRGRRPGDLARVERSGEERHDDEGEEDSEGEHRAIATQASQREHPATRGGPRGEATASPIPAQHRG